jgi:hypothetical protein
VTVRCLAFGDLDAGVWGAAWIPGDGPVSVAAGAGPASAVAAAELEGDGVDRDWSLRGDGLELSIAAAGDPAGIEAASALDGVDQLSHATGRITLDGTEHQIDAPGWRAVLGTLPNDDELLSLRLVSAWFGPGDGLALLALRPRRARGQEGDLVAATVFEPERALPVSDPRLSTTYAASGLPARAGVELWTVTEPVEPEGEPQEHPHRAAGEALGPRATWTEGRLALEAAPFRWHSNGRDGAGVYLLGQFE